MVNKIHMRVNQHQTNENMAQLYENMFRSSRLQESEEKRTRILIPLMYNVIVICIARTRREGKSTLNKDQPISGQMINVR